MKKSTLYLKALTNIVLYVIGLILVVLFVPKLFIYFLPFVIGLIVSAIANPAVKFFEEKIKFKRKASSAVMIILIIALIILLGYGIIAFFINQGVGLAESIPSYWQAIKEGLDNLGKSLEGVTKNLPKDVQESFENLGATLETSVASFISSLGSSDVTSNLVSSISSGIGSIANVFIGIVMCVLSAYFFTVEHNNLLNGLDKYLPKAAYAKCKAAYRGLKNAVGGYFKAQLQIEMWVYLITVVGLLICRINYAVIIALGIAILDFLPFFGAGLIMIPWGVILLFNGEYLLAIGMFVTWGVGQLVRQLIQPKIVGDNVGVAPLPTLILLYIGYKWIGVFGMVIAMPVAMIFISLYREGLFTNLVNSLRIIWDGISSFRRLPDRDEKENEE